MHVLRLEAAEQLRSQAHESALSDGRRAGTELASIAAVDDAAAQVAWSSFVPFLAHPVMASGAHEAMKLIDAAAATTSLRRDAL